MMQPQGLVTANRRSLSNDVKSNYYLFFNGLAVLMMRLDGIAICLHDEDHRWPFSKWYIC